MPGKARPRKLLSFFTNLTPRGQEALASIALAISVPLAFYATGIFGTEGRWPPSEVANERLEVDLVRTDAMGPSKEVSGGFRFRHPFDSRGSRPREDSKSNFVRRFIVNRHRLIQLSKEQSRGGRASATGDSIVSKLDVGDDSSDAGIIRVEGSGVETDGEEDGDVAVDREIDSGTSRPNIDSDEGIAETQIDHDHGHNRNYKRQKYSSTRQGFHISDHERAMELAAETGSGEDDEDDPDAKGLLGKPFLSGRLQSGDDLAVDESQLAQEMSLAKDLSYTRSKSNTRQSGQWPSLPVSPSQVVRHIIKEAAAKSLLICPCDSEHADWVRPLVAGLQKENPNFRFSCVAGSSTALTRAREALSTDHRGREDGLALEATYRTLDFWEPGIRLPQGDVVLAFSGIEWVPAGRLLAFLSHLGETANAKDVLVGHFPHIPRHDPTHASWIQSLRANKLHAHNLHHMMRTPFMFPPPKRSFEGLDKNLPQKEMLWYKANNLVNRFS